MSTTRDHDEMVDGLKMLADKIDEVLQRLQAGEAADEDRACCGALAILATRARTRP